MASSMSNGPISVNIPKRLDAPGPPCSQSSTGASVRPDSAGANTKYVLESVALSIVMKPLCSWEAFQPSSSTFVSACASL